MGKKKKLNIEIEVDEEKYYETLDVLEYNNLTVENAVEQFFNNVSFNHVLPFDVDEEGKAKNKDSKDNYVKAIVDVLAGHYDYIYYVNVLDGTYLEFNTNNVFRVLEIGETGKDFFSDTIKNIDIIIYQDDRERVKKALTKKNLLKALEEKSSMSLVYRMITTPTPNYFLLVASYAGSDRTKIIIEVRNIDESIRKERQQARELERVSSLAHIDSLTKCLNYLAFQEEKDRLSLKLKNNEHDFAVLMCDLNELKNINDDKGHMVGDEYLVKTADILRSTFHNSRTFRIGGDEFFIVLEGEDFLNRYELVETVKYRSEANINNDEPVIAVGLAEVTKDIRDFSSLFVVADHNMYEHKHQLKELYKD